MGVFDNIRRAFRKAGGRRVIRVKTRDRISSMFNESPERIGSILRGALSGDPDSFGDFCAMADRYVLTDPRLRATYEKRRRKIVKWPYTITESEADPQGEQIAEEIEQDLENWPRFRRTCLWELTDAVGKGLGAVELMAEVREDRLVPTGSRGVPQWSIRHPRDMEGYEDESRWEHQTETGWEEVPPGKLLTWEMENQGSFVTGGLMWSVIWYSLFKHFAIKDWVAFLEAYGQPLRVGKYPVQFDENSNEVEILARAVIDIASDAGVVIPEGMAIEFVEGMKSGSPEAFEKLARYIDEAIAELFLGGTLTTSSGEKGARSLGEVHQDETQEIVDFDAQDLAEVLNGMIEMFVRANHGDRPGYPKFKFNTTRIDDLHKQMLVDQALHTMNLPLSVSQLREIYGRREPEDEDDTLQQPTPPMQGLADGGSGPSTAASVAGPFLNARLKKKLNLT